ncbi:hypothetical protein D9611_001717 [Ephemerocybe angulata]|uniref:Uncharacterized protein n=1 Tax=Ephemerocybe angulata TaxID=980116 RepID=A0A8H5FLX4_9AGAR|nr:hypothetical protein D9611_001717 [Tulosesus angulatus]
MSYHGHGHPSASTTPRSQPRHSSRLNDVHEPHEVHFGGRKVPSFGLNLNSGPKYTLPVTLPISGVPSTPVASRHRREAASYRTEDLHLPPLEATQTATAQGRSNRTSGASSYTPLTSPPARALQSSVHVVPRMDPPRPSPAVRHRATIASPQLGIIAPPTPNPFLITRTATPPTPNPFLIARTSLSASSNKPSRPSNIRNVTDIGYLLRERDKADIELRKARQRERYAVKMFNSGDPNWPEERCKTVMARTDAYLEDAKLKRLAYKEAKAMKGYGYGLEGEGRPQSPEDAHWSADVTHENGEDDKRWDDDSSDEERNGVDQERNGKNRSDEEHDDEERTDEERTDEERTDEERTDEERTNEERTDDERGDEERTDDDERDDEERTDDERDDEERTDDEEMDVAFLRSEHAKAQRQVKLAREREKYARKMNNAEHYKWNLERVQEVADVTKRRERDCEAWRRRLEKATKANKGVDNAHSVTGRYRIPPSAGASTSTPRQTPPKSVDRTRLLKQWSDADYEVAKAKKRETYAKDMLRASNPAWPQERYAERKEVTRKLQIEASKLKRQYEMALGRWR